jgi:uncharacterized protein
VDASGPTWGRALVTGASAGLGATFARHLARGGADLVLVARREDLLRDLAGELVDSTGVAVETLAADLASEDGVAEVCGRLRSDADPVDLLVSNAGITSMGRLHRLEPERERQLVRLNAEAVVLLAQAHLAGLSEREASGAIVNVASLSAFQPLPAMATYAATKAFVVTLSESLANAYGGRGVRVQALCPGFIRTEMAAANDLDEAAGRIPDRLWLDPDRVVRESLAGLDRGRVVVIPGAGYRWLHRVTAALPRGVQRTLVGRFAR